MRRLIATLALCAGCAVPAFADPAMTTAPVVMRAAPSPKARIVQSIPANARIDLSHCSRDWCYASWRDRFGYVRAAAIAAAPYESGAPGVLRSRLLRAPGSRRALVGLGSTILLRLWMGPSLVATAEPHVHPRHGVSGVGVSGPLPSIHENRLATTRSAIARRVWREAEPTWGSATTLSSSSSAGRHVGLVLVDVEPGRENPALPHRFDQRRLVDQRAARDVDQHAVGAERRDHFAVDDMAGRPRRRARRPSRCRRPSPCRGARDNRDRAPRPALCGRDRRLRARKPQRAWRSACRCARTREFPWCVRAAKR